MRSITRMVLGSLLAVPLTVGAAGAAMADDFTEHTAVAGPEGTEHYIVHSAVDNNGDTHFFEHYSATGHDGAYSSTTAASTGNWGRGDHRPSGTSEATYLNTTNAAGPDGAWSSTTMSNVGGYHWGHGKCNDDPCDDDDHDEDEDEDCYDPCKDD